MVFVAGATGFIGRHLVRALKGRGIQVRCLTRSPERAAVCNGLGFQTHLGSIADRESLAGALDGADAAVHLVGIIEEAGGQTFASIHVQGTTNLVDAAVRAGVRHFIYISSLGTGTDAVTTYHKTKATAEEIVKGSGMGWSILRPSLVIGREGGFTEKLKEFITSPLPFIPVPGRGEALYQPVFVEDLAECMARLLEMPEPPNRVFDVGGPEHLSYNEMVLAMAQAMGVKKPLLHIPMGLMMPVVRVLEKTPFRPVTVEQLLMLEMGNTAEPDCVKKNFGFEPKSYREALGLIISPPGPDR